MIHLTKIFRFEAAHALMGYDGRCRNIHGHSYEMRVTVKGMPIMDDSSPKNGMVMDFGDLKRIVNEEIIDHYDHAFIINHNMPQEFVDEVKRNYERIIVLPYQPTTELMLIDFSKKIKSRLPEGIQLVKIFLKETEGSYAEWIEE
ncbi:MAG: 6-carboxytetrahydropterin synthase [Bacteroidales bacterium]|nr:6-carboxytetrahydropterin synthase [Bacteroidales bacterium]